MSKPNLKPNIETLKPFLSTYRHSNSMGASASRERFKSHLLTLTPPPSSALSPTLAPAFFSDFWLTPSSPSDVFTLLTPSYVRLLLSAHFPNYEQLFNQATAQLCQIVETPYGIYFDQALNCVRVLTRFVPFLLELEGDGVGVGDGDGGEEDNGKLELKEKVEVMCWSKKTASSSDDTESETETEPEADGAIALNEEQESLALLVVHAAMHMLFLPHFTCDFFDEKEDENESESETEKKREKEKEKESTNGILASHASSSPSPTSPSLRRASSTSNSNDNPPNPLLPNPLGIIWTAGVHANIEDLYCYQSTKLYDKNRIEVMRLLLACCGGKLFTRGENGDENDNENENENDNNNTTPNKDSRWLSVAVARDAPNAAALFYSLLNTVLSHSFNNPAGVPYLGRGMTELQELSLQLLIVFLDGNNNNNIFRELLSSIKSPSDLKFCWDGFVRLLSNTYESNSTYLPGSVAKINCHQEVLVLFWKFLEENEGFGRFVLGMGVPEQSISVAEAEAEAEEREMESETKENGINTPPPTPTTPTPTTNFKPNICELVVPLCYLILSSRSDPCSVGLVNICTFILLKLSGERTFGVALNQPFLKRLPVEMPRFTGSHADLVAISLHKLIIMNDRKLASLTR